MLCYLDAVEVRPREGKVPFLICTWKGVQGDANAAMTYQDVNTGKRMVNLQAAKARTITVTKSIFPTDMDALASWCEQLVCETTRVPKKDAAGNYTDEMDVIVSEARKQQTWINLLYVQVPLSRISNDVKCISFFDRSGVEHKNTYITVVGFATTEDEWAEDQTPEAMALRNLTDNLENGTYTAIEPPTQQGINGGSAPSQPQAQQQQQSQANPFASLFR